MRERERGGEACLVFDSYLVRLLHVKQVGVPNVLSAVIRGSNDFDNFRCHIRFKGVTYVSKVSYSVKVFHSYVVSQ
jgi:hypothetical protein